MRLLLVAVPDPDGSAFPREATGFSPVTNELRNELRGKRIAIVSSTDDPYSTSAYTLQRVAQWNAAHISLASCGHINAASGLGDWAEGGASSSVGVMRENYTFVEIRLRSNSNARSHWT